MIGMPLIRPLSPRDALTWSWLLVWSLVAFIWAFAEAVWFFIMVDVLISLAVMRFGVLRAMVPTLAALIGALLGGIVLYEWARVNPETVRTFILTVPGISEELLRTVSVDMADEPLSALFFGGFTGVPFKIFAATAYEASIAPLQAFLQPAAIARLSRFIAIVAVSGALRYLLYTRLRRVGLMRLALFIWVVFYAWFGYVFWNIV
uniref:hypothetical protein n=1 Tax=Pararhizobium sp. IMCC3301 TaxID=3067904 RepID=UPI00274207FD|nr:hypothetical protein [Pararhizobium sp. IMCC3301]